LRADGKTKPRGRDLKLGHHTICNSFNVVINLRIKRIADGIYASSD